MWPNRPSSRASPGDHYNNNSTATNPYSRGAATPKPKPGRQSTDPWDWGTGWEENSGQQDEWNNGWSQTPAPAPNVIPTPPPSLYHQNKSEKKAHGTPDLIPDKVNNVGRGNMMQMRPQQPYSQPSNPSDFFENIDLVSQNHQTSLHPVYNSYDMRQPQQMNVQQNYSTYQPQNSVNRHPSPASYFQQQPHATNNESMTYHQPPPLAPNMYQNSQFFQPEHTSQHQVVEPSNHYYDQNQVMSPEHANYYNQNTFVNNVESSFQRTTGPNTGEVENVEVAPPEQTAPSTNLADPLRTSSQNSTEVYQENNLTNTEETNIPDNQEMVPDNEEHLQDLPHKLSQLKLLTSPNIESWNNSSGWENQEVAPRCELDRNQYLETGQLDANEPEDVPSEIDNNDEGEALPPPGLHRMVTGQGTESLSQRSVVGQNNGSGFVRLVPGQPTPSASPSLERHVPGQQNNEDLLASSQRMVPGHQSQDSLQRFAQESQGELQRLIPGQTENDMGMRMIPGQLSDDENNIGGSELERMIPGGTSDREGGPDDERMVPGGMSDDSRSQSISNDEETRNSSERMIPGMTEMPQQTDNHSERLVTGAGSINDMDNSVAGSTQDISRHVGGGPSVSQPPLGLHRLVLGQINSEDSTNSDHATSKTSERAEEKSGGNPPPGMHRMVVGQFREKEAETDNDKDKETIKSNEREDDSDSDFRSERRRPRHRRDSFDDERKERDYSSEREFRGKREDRREYRKKRDSSYTRSPEYRSDNEEYDRNEYRDRRDRDRRDRPRDRDRRRRSPEYDRNYDPYYRGDESRKYPPRERDRRYYDPYDDDPYYYRENRSSRPSSRSGSDYRRPREYPQRQGYYPDPGGMGNYMHYYQIQQYYENMRRNDPQAYALWYERYMAEKFGAASNDRASVHSGRSSANDTSQLNENEEVEGTKAEDTVSQRSTPPLYSSAHIRGQFNMLGQLVVVNPHDPFSYGEHQATVTVCKVAGANSADDPDTLEFLHNPGPFISGVTHKNTVLQYLKRQSDQFSHSSEKLLYELIRLVIKLNGVVDMTDVADLLIESYHGSHPEADDYSESPPEVDESPPLSPHKITSRFRELLLEGNKTEALEWAMKNKDWGHALFLASKMDTRTHNNVMLRFANGLQNNDPLQTLYQLMSGREPQAATCAADKKWGDWRPHLAMMLSNRTSNIELDRKAIITLGDSLGARGRLFASHFCYLTAQLEFTNYSDRHAKLVLLGASPDKPFPQFASCRAIMLTLCYEYAKQLSSKEWCIPTLRPYKFLLACRLLDHGSLATALAHLECLAQEVVRLPCADDRPLLPLIVDMADKLKCADTYSTDPSCDPDWLAKLKYHAEETNDPNYLQTQLHHGISTSTVSEMEPISGGDYVTQPAVQEVTQGYTQDASGYTTTTTDGHGELYSQDNYYNTPQNNYYNPAQSIPLAQDTQQVPGYGSDQQQQGGAVYYGHNPGWDQSSTQPLADTLGPPPPEAQISLKPGFGYYANTEDNLKPQIPKETPAALTDKTESKNKSSRRSNKTQQSSGWFGGIFDFKLPFRPKNQMILPDDKNPAIVWDEKTKRWVNMDASEEEQSTELKPPPKASELNGSVPVAPTVSTLPAGPG